MKRALVLPLTTALLLALTGCITVQVTPNDDRDADGRPIETISCETQRSVTLDEPDTNYSLGGSCREVVVEGRNISVAAEEVRELVVRGDDNVLSIGSFETLSVEGQRNDIETLDGGDATIKGNENALHSADDLDAVNVSGQNNDVTAEGFIASLDENDS